MSSISQIIKIYFTNENIDRFKFRKDSNFCTFVKSEKIENLLQISKKFEFPMESFHAIKNGKFEDFVDDKLSDNHLTVVISELHKTFSYEKIMKIDIISDKLFKKVVFIIICVECGLIASELINRSFPINFTKIQSRIRELVRKIDKNYVVDAGFIILCIAEKLEVLSLQIGNATIFDQFFKEFNSLEEYGKKTKK